MISSAAELDKMLEAKNQTLRMYGSMVAEKAKFAEKKKEYKDYLNKMSIELEAKLASKSSLMNDNKALQIWGKKANQQAVVERKKAEDWDDEKCACAEGIE